MTECYIVLPVANIFYPKDLGISTQSIGQTLETLYGGKTVTKFNRLGKEYPIILQADIENRTGKVMVDDVFEMNVEPIKNPVSGQPHRARIDIPSGFEYTMAEMASGTVKTQGTIDLPYNNGTHSHMCELHWNNSGIIRD